MILKTVLATPAQVTCISQIYEKVVFSFDVIEVDEYVKNIKLKWVEVSDHRVNLETQFFNGHVLSIFAKEANPWNLYPSSFQFIFNPHQDYYSMKLIDYGHFAGREPTREEFLECEVPSF